MKNKNAKKIIDACLDELESLITLITEVGDEAKSTQYLKKYAILRAIGSIETAYRLILTDKLIKGQHTYAKNFIKKKVRDLTPDTKFGTIKAMLAEFDDQWLDRFNHKIQLHNGIRHVVALTFLTDMRDTFARGENPDIPIETTIVNYKNVIQIMKILDEVVHHRYDEAKPA